MPITKGGNKGHKSVSEQTEPTLREVLNIVLDLVKKVGGIDSKVGGLGSQVGSLDSKVGGLGSQVGSLESKLDNLSTEMNEHFTNVQKDFAGMQKNFDTLEAKHDVLENKVEFGFSELHRELRQTEERLDQKIDEVKVDIQKLSQRTLEDTDANVKDILNLQKKVALHDIRIQKVESKI